MSDMLTNYWLIKLLLLAGLLLLAWFVMRPIRNPNQLALKRLGMLLMIVFAAFAVLFPGLLNRLAAWLGVERGINLLLYALVLAFFMQVATTYRRDADTEKRLTQLARAIALSTHPPLPHYRDDDAYSGTTSDSVFPADAKDSTEPLPDGDETKDAGAPLDNDADDK